MCREQFQSIQRSCPQPLTSDTGCVPLSRRRAYRQIGFVAEGSGGLLGLVVWEEASGGSQENRSDCVRGFTGTEHVATPPHPDPTLPPSLPPPSLTPSPACIGITSSINQAFDAADLSLCSTPSTGLMNKPVVATSENTASVRNLWRYFFFYFFLLSSLLRLICLPSLCQSRLHTFKNRD